MKDLQTDSGAPALKKFQDKYLTAGGVERASVALTGATTLWFNTGTLCNIECVNCYIESSPTNDALVYMSAGEVESYLDQITTRAWPIKEIGFTGGEPFMNPAFIAMVDLALSRGFKVLILTNAMVPMMRKRVRDGLIALNARFPKQMTLRVSLDHYHASENDQIRGEGSFDIALTGMDWLRDHGFEMAVAGRTLWQDTETQSRAGYAQLFADRGYQVAADNPGQLVLFPEMDESVDVPEITTACWGILDKDPKDIMCASSRMVVKRKGAAAPTVLACTLLPYAEEFDLGKTLAEAEGDIHLNHRHCAKFCVLGGASCSA